MRNLCLYIMIAAGFPAIAQQWTPSEEVRKQLWSSMLLGKAGERRTVEGNLVDLDCLLVRGGIGQPHLRCSRLCAKKGLPVGFLDSQGRIYMITSRIHVSPERVNEPLMPFLETTVRITGDFLEAEDMRAVVVERIEKASQQASLEDLRLRVKQPGPGEP